MRDEKPMCSPWMSRCSAGQDSGQTWQPSYSRSRPAFQSVLDAVRLLLWSVWPRLSRDIPEKPTAVRFLFSFLFSLYCKQSYTSAFPKASAFTEVTSRGVGILDQFQQTWMHLLVFSPKHRPRACQVQGSGAWEDEHGPLKTVSRWQRLKGKMSPLFLAHLYLLTVIEL